MRIIDDFLNNITMYRLILYYLLVLAIVALIYSIFGVLPFNFLNLIFSFLFITSVSWLCNVTFAEIFKVPTNLESVYITSLILFLIISPARHTHDLFFLGWIAVISEASKYIFALKKKHIFNPAAFAVLLTYFVLNQSASWWIGTASMFPFVLIGGLLLTRKIKRFDLVLSFLMVASLTIIFFTLGKRTDLATILKKTYLDSPILFFAFVMLTEPLTTPGTFDLRVLYGAITGFLFAPQLKLGLLTTTPEIALVLGNIFSYLVGSKEKLILTLSQKIKINPDSYDFVFNLVDPPKFNPGQYMEWTLGHQSPDSRGNRRYFTISSSPTEKNIRIAVKFHENGSSFKRRMLEMNVGDKIVASQITGDFTLPKDTGKKLVFVAGGIGITPFRSIIKYLSDTNEKRDIVLLYSNKKDEDVVYRDIFDEGVKKFGLRVIYIATETQGRIDSTLIQKQIPDFKERTFYLSGPHMMVISFEEVLSSLGLSKGQIKVDYFPGY